MTFKDQLRNLGFETYDAYLASPHWSSFRIRYNRSGASQRCAVCGDPLIELHHRTYRNLGHEELADVVPLCRRDHELVHAMLKISKRFVEDTGWAIAQLKPKAAKPEQVHVQRTREQEERRAERNERRRANREKRRQDNRALRTNLTPTTIKRAVDDRPDHEVAIGAIVAGIKRPVNFWSHAAPPRKHHMPKCEACGINHSKKGQTMCRPCICKAAESEVKRCLANHACGAKT